MDKMPEITMAPWHSARVLWKNRGLLWRLVEREVLGRYRGSLIGWGWTFLQPLLMLLVYTFVFSQVFVSRWGGQQTGGPLAFAVNLFAGLVVFNLFAECANKAPALVLDNPNYVKKVIFPLEILTGVSVASASFHALTSLVILMVFELLAFHQLPPTILLIPLVWLPLILVCLGISWVLAALAVFLRDISQIVQVLVTMLMFLSPVFFPISALPPQWRPFLSLNPLAEVIEETRRVAIQGALPNPIYLLAGILGGLLMAELGCRFFQRAKRAFADVL